MEDAAWRAQAESEREARHQLYAGPDTPFAPEARARFAGLRGWPYDARFRVRARLERHGTPRAAGLSATGDESIAMLELGALVFTLLGQPCRLLAFAPAPGEADEDYILVPFRDATSGRETYGGGRYLDLDPTDAEEVVLDFNRAYHPYCAYDDAWSCTIPPPENRLGLRVEAGERLA